MDHRGPRLTLPLVLETIAVQKPFSKLISGPKVAGRQTRGWNAYQNRCRPDFFQKAMSSIIIANATAKDGVGRRHGLEESNVCERI